MNKPMSVALVSTLLWGCAASTTPQLRAVVTDSGTYEIHAYDGAIDSEYNYSGKRQIISEWSWLEPTYRIPLERGTNFGFCFDLIGLQGRGHEVDITIAHPEMIRPDGRRTQGYTRPQALEVIDGVPGYCPSWSLEYPHELVAGEWRFTIRYHGKVVLEQRFTLYPPTERPQIDADRVGA